MQSQTEDILSSTLGDEFKVEVAKRDDIIKKLNAVKDNITAEIATLNNTLKDLNAKKNALQEDITMAYATKEADFKKQWDTFTTSIKNSTKSLDLREKGMEDKYAKHEEDVKLFLKEVSDLNKEKANFSLNRKEIAMTLTQLFESHGALFTEMINVVNENDLEPVPVEEPKEEVKETETKEA